MTDIRELWAEAGDKKSFPPSENRKRSRKPSGHPVKTPAPLASLWSSEVAERWLALALEQGYEPPYNANYLANEIETRTQREPRIMRLTEEGRAGDIPRWVMKMAELFWKTDWEDGFTYVRAGDSAAKIKEIFLVEAWDDLVVVAFDSLRAAYLKVHGHGKAAPDYGDHEASELHEELQKVRLGEFLDRENQEREHPRDLHALDEHTKSVLSSGQERKAGP